jgi:outer membrane protein TolC
VLFEIRISRLTSQFLSQGKKFLFCLFLFSSNLLLQSQESLFISLDTALQRALTHNRQILEQEQQIQIAKSSYQMDIRQYFPQVTFSWSDNATVNQMATDSYSKQLSAKISQFITDGGRSGTMRRLSLIQLGMQDQQFQDAKDALLDQAWAVYMQTAMAREKMALQRASLELSQKQLEIITIELNQGNITQLEYIDAQLKVKNLEISLAGNKTELRGKEREFLVLLSLPRDIDFTLEDPGFSEYSGLILPGVNRLMALALLNNRETEQIEFQIQQAQEEIRLAKQQFVPEVRLEASVSVSGSQFPLSQPQTNISLSFQFPGAGSPFSVSASGGSQSQTSSNRNTSISATPLQDITTGLNMKSLELKITSLRAQQGEFMEQLQVEVENIMDQYDLLKDQLRLERERLILEKAKYEVLNRQWELGEIKQLELISAASSLSEREIQLLDLVMSLIQTERKIEQFLGVQPGVLQDISTLVESDNSISMFETRKPKQDEQE